MGPVESQLEELRSRFRDVQAQLLPSGTTLVTVANIPLPAGWNKSSTTIRFLVPPGYPFAALDCFWGDLDLRLEGERLPQNAQTTNPIPEVNAPGLWFSWHLMHPWNANRDNLSTWMNAVLDRLRRTL